MARTPTLNESQDAGRMPVAAQYLVIALDCARPLAAPVRLWLDVEEVHIGRGARRAWSRQDAVLRIELADSWMSSAHARLVPSGPGSWEVEDAGSKNGTIVNGQRITRAKLGDGDVLEVGTTMLVYRSLTHEGRGADLAMDERAANAIPRTLHAPWGTSLAIALRLAASRVPLLLLGETGTGKEVLARAVHTVSERSGPFVAINCGAIARTLIESELFGVKKGAFSGATEDRPGLLRSADGGTLLLDEIAELPEPSQVALLRVLQGGEVVPVGDTRVVQVDIRVIAATHTDLKRAVEAGRFRADLYARLRGHTIELPPLRERREDIGLLVAELLRRLAGERAERITFARPAGRALLSYPWPYNVRELEQALQAAVAISSDDEIALGDLPEMLRSEPVVAHVVGTMTPEPDGLSAERDRIVAALEACAGNQTQAARRLGISRATLVNKLGIHRLPRPRKN